jgi:glycosyltransferase involved in cell wall biosynthesis
MPGFELVPMDRTTLSHRLLHGNKLAAVKQIVTQILLTISPRLAQRLVEKKYQVPYEKSDKVVLLSDGFIPQYDQFVCGDKEHYCAIPNMTSFLKIAQESPKKKEVLVVSRMEERQKRIKYVLRVWRKACQEDWTLRIVGYGEDLDYYKQLVRRWDLKNIYFEGLQDPLPYYQDASIFLMVSAFEGWGLTITEAQQCGCVPIAFDSYSAVHDIIQSGRNGYVVPNNDIDAYAQVLRELMNNDTLRAELAANAQKDVQRFSRENIAKQWKTLLENL